MLTSTTPDFAAIPDIRGLENLLGVQKAFDCWQASTTWSTIHTQLVKRLKLRYRPAKKDGFGPAPLKGSINTCTPFHVHNYAAPVIWTTDFAHWYDDETNTHQTSYGVVYDGDRKFYVCLP